MEPNSSSHQGGPSPERGPMLPTPEAPAEAHQGASVERAPAAQEVDRPAGESANQNSGMPLPTPVPQPVTRAAPVATTTDQPVATDIGAPDLADDVDVIEKEWVDKAKQIVKANVDDPAKQNHDVSMLKADYMKKRYGKDIKVPEDDPKKA